MADRGRSRARLAGSRCARVLALPGGHARSAPIASLAATSSTKPRDRLARCCAGPRAEHQHPRHRASGVATPAQPTNSSDSSMAAPAWHKRDPLRSVALRARIRGALGREVRGRNTRRVGVGRSSATAVLAPMGRRSRARVGARSGPLVVKNGSKMRTQRLGHAGRVVAHADLDDVSDQTRHPLRCDPRLRGQRCLAFTEIQEDCSTARSRTCTTGRSGSSRAWTSTVRLRCRSRDGSNPRDLVHGRRSELVARHPREALHSHDDAADAADALDALPTSCGNLPPVRPLAGFQRGESVSTVARPCSFGCEVASTNARRVVDLVRSRRRRGCPPSPTSGLAQQVLVRRSSVRSRSTASGRGGRRRAREDTWR